MKSLAVRLALCALFVVASGVATYLLWTSELHVRQSAVDARSFDSDAVGVERAVLELRAAQQAYVAAGQGDQFWVPKVAASIVAIEESLAALRAKAGSAAAQSALDSAASAAEDFEQLDRRARDYVRNGQKLLASDLIFADGLEVTSAMIGSVEQARGAESVLHTAAQGSVRRAEAVALGAAAVVALAAMLLLVPRTDITPEDRVEPESAPASPVPLRFANDFTPAHTQQPDRDSAPQPSSVDLDTIASVCSDLARVVDTRALPALLGRAATILDAPGIVLWIADPDGRELSPIVTSGYSQQMVLRLGTILRDAENATAAAFRTCLLQTVAADPISNGAIAAPLVTPAGCVGVMAAEVRHQGESDPAKLAAASIIAAQLATLVGPPSTRAQARADAV